MVARMFATFNTAKIHNTQCFLGAPSARIACTSALCTHASNSVTLCPCIIGSSSRSQAHDVSCPCPAHSRCWLCHPAPIPNIHTVANPSGELRGQLAGPSNGSTSAPSTQANSLFVPPSEPFPSLSSTKLPALWRTR